MSTLGYALLALLSTKPRTGYELAQRMKRPIAYMWAAQHSQIYPELARLAKAGLVTAEVIPGRGPRDTKRYALTPAGRDALTAWVTSPLAPEVPRSEMLLRIRSLWLVSPDEAIAFVAEQRQRYAERLEVLREEGVGFAPDDLMSIDDPEFFAYATLHYGVVRVRAALDWCDWLLHQLRSGKPEVVALPEVSAAPG